MNWEREMKMTTKENDNIEGKVTAATLVVNFKILSLANCSSIFFLYTAVCFCELEAEGHCPLFALSLVHDQLLPPRPWMSPPHLKG